MRARDVIDEVHDHALGEVLVPFTADDLIEISQLVHDLMADSAYYISDLMASQYRLKFTLDDVNYQRERVKYSLETGHELPPLFGVVGAFSWALLKTDKGWTSAVLGPTSATIPRDSTYHRDLRRAFLDFVNHQDSIDLSQ